MKRRPAPGPCWMLMFPPAGFSQNGYTGAIWQDSPGLAKLGVSAPAVYPARKTSREDKMRSKRAIHGLLTAATALGLMQAPAQAQPATADFYRDNAINLIIGFPVGGGYDIYGRLVSRHLGKHIAGNPKIVPQNMIGAGGMKAANFMYGVAPKDGSTLGII